MGRKIVFNKGVQEVITTLYNWKGGKFIKVELEIKETYEEEKLIVQTPQPTEKVQKVIEFAENLDQKETIKGKIEDQVYLVEIGKIQRFYIENRKVLAETASQTYTIDLRLYQVLDILPTTFIQISQSEIVNIDAISHLKLTPNGLVEIFLKNESFTYSSRRYLKTIKEKLELWKNKSFTMQPLAFSSASSSLSSFHSFMHQIPMPHWVPSLS